MAKGIPGQIRKDSVVLMAIVAIVREYEVGLAAAFNPFKGLFDSGELSREKALSKLLNPHHTVLNAAKEMSGTSQGFLPPAGVGTKYDPLTLQIGIFTDELQQSAAAPNLDVVRVRTQADNLEPLLRRQIEQFS